MGTWIAQAVVYIFEGLVAIGVSEATAVVVTDLIIKVVGLQLLSYASKKLGPDYDFANEAAGRQLTVRSTIEPQKAVYGQALVSGPVAYYNVDWHQTADNVSMLCYIIALVGHECEAITDIWLDNEEILESQVNWIDLGGGNDGRVNAGTFFDATTSLPLAWFDRKLGTATQARTSLLQAGLRIAADWTSAHQGRGICYLACRFDWRAGLESYWEQGPPTNMKALVKGKKVYDPRLDTIHGTGTGSHDYTDSTTWEWSDNPALCLADYLINDKFGLGEDPATRIDWDMVVTAANNCDATVNIPTAATDKRFRCNGSLTSNTEHATNIEDLISSFNATVLFSGGKWRMHPWAYETPTISIDESNLAGSLQVQLTNEKGNRFNTVRGYFIDPERLYQTVEFPERTSSEYVTRDKGRTLTKEIRLPFTNDQYGCQRVAQGLLDQSDLEVVVIAPSKFSVSEVNIGQNIQLSVDALGWVNRVFKVTGFKYRDLQGVDLVLREDLSDAYVDMAEVDYTTRTGAVITTGAEGPRPPSNLAVATVNGEVVLTWDSPPARLYERVLIYRSFSNDRTAATLAGSSTGTKWIDTIYDERPRWYWVRSENFAGDVSDYEPDTTTSTITTDRVLQESIFSEEFGRGELAPWIEYDAGTYEFNENGEFGGGALKITAERLWIYHANLIPFDPDALYELEIKVRRTAATAGTNEAMYFGVEGVAANRSTLLNVIGSNVHTSQHYFGLEGEDQSSWPLNEWQVFNGYVMGQSSSPVNGEKPDPNNPGRMYTGTTYIRPLLIANHNGGVGEVEIDHITIRKLNVGDERDMIVPDPYFSRGGDHWVGYSALTTNGE